MTNKIETLKISIAGIIGGAGVAVPSLEKTSQFFMGITPILSFFLILIPTGIWAWIRAIDAINKKKDRDV